MTAPIAPLLGLEPDALIELYVLDMTNINGSVYRFCNWSQTNGASVIWQFLTYQAIPIQVEGFEVSGRGQLPTPQLTISNILGVVTGLILSHNDIAGAKLIRKRTLARYLDSMPTADPSQFFPDDVYFVDRKVSEDKLQCVFELNSALDLAGFQPGRVLLADSCVWVYRGAECGYTGAAVQDELGQPTTDLSRDKCTKSLSGCKARFGNFNLLPFSSFPGVDNQRT
ncbi:MAG: phage minor tail protein L [Stenomitos frigidus ULC029]